MVDISTSGVSRQEPFHTISDILIWHHCGPGYINPDAWDYIGDAYGGGRGHYFNNEKP